MPLPDPFRTRMQQALGPEFPAFLAALDTPAPVSIRLHPRKQVVWEENFDKVKWYPGGVYLPERPVFTLDPLYHAGAYYVQEASSMFVAEAVRQLIPAGRPLRALDLAAAPGGKSTLLADALPAGSLLLANEVIRGRYQILQENLMRWGYPHTHAANHDPRDFAGLAGFFDLVLLDAPCSGEGLFRKDPAATAEWSEAAVGLCAARQRRILADALPLVAPGGVFLYATCTYNDQENEENVGWIAAQPGYQHLELTVPADWGIVARGGGYQFYPHRVRGEGFFLAAFRRQGGEPYAGPHPAAFQSLTALPRRQTEALRAWLTPGEELAFFQKPQGGILALPAAQREATLILAHHLRRLQLGTPLGIFKGGDFVPDHALALSVVAHPELPAAELSREQALLYLKKESPAIDPIPAGWALARHRGLNLGWFKGLANRVNNYLPKEWRIRMDVRE